MSEIFSIKKKKYIYICQYIPEAKFHSTKAYKGT